jgi:hypothetical protein
MNSVMNAMRDRLHRQVTAFTGWKLDWSETDVSDLVTEASFEIPDRDFNLWVELRPANKVRLAFFNEQDEDIQDAMPEMLPRLIGELTLAGFQVEG